MTAPAAGSAGAAAPAVVRNLSDQRRLLRESLRQHVFGKPEWAEPSLAIFRNRLLDDVGSDARPLANLLLEALSRGLAEKLPRSPLAPMQWNARCTSIVMQWVGERFVQPEAARWAVESWAFAFGAITSAQLTAFVDPAVQAEAPTWSASPSPTAGNRGAAPSPAGGTPTATRRQNSPRKGTRQGAVAQRPVKAPRTFQGPLPSPAAGAGGRLVGRPGYGAAAASRNASMRASSAQATRLAKRMTAAVLGTLTVGVVALAVQVIRAPSRPTDTRQPAIASSQTGTPPLAGTRAATANAGAPVAGDPALVDSLRAALSGEPRLNTAEATSGQGGSAAPPPPVSYGVPNSATGLGGQATVVPLAPGNGRAPSLAMTRLPAVGATPSAYRELAARSQARQLAEAARGEPAAGAAASGAGTVPQSPGVPGITQNALPLSEQQQASARRIRPATRPTQRRVAQPPSIRGSGAARVPTAAQGATGSRTGRAGTTGAVAGASPRPDAPAGAPSSTPSAASQGLDEIRLESGRRLRGRVDVIRASSVVFRDAQTGLRYEFPKDDIAEIIAEFGNSIRFRAEGGAAPGSSDDRRTGSVAGRYLLSYEAARVDGAPACRDLWRGSSQSDVANVTHLAGADTLTVAFEGGDNFPSIMDADGFFSSTFRVMPGQAELATALTTRLNGGFTADGQLSVQITVIGYRRVQGTRGVACQITVQANGTREAPGP